MYNVVGMWKTKRGFTLVELIIVMSIIAVVAGTTVVISITTNLQRGRDTKRKADLTAIQSALEIYRSDMGAYPGGTAALSPTYIGAVPTDPSTKAAYAYNPAGTSYTLCATLENPVSQYCVSNP